MREIIDLIDREMDLMRRNVKERNLEGLRKRICTLFLQYIKTPAFNPKVAKLLKVGMSGLQVCCYFLLISCFLVDYYLQASGGSAEAQADLDHIF